MDRDRCRYPAGHHHPAVGIGIVDRFARALLARHYRRHEGNAEQIRGLGYRLRLFGVRLHLYAEHTDADRL